MKHSLVIAAVLASAAVTSASAQDFDLLRFRAVSVELGLGAKIAPDFPGSDEAEVTPWLIWRNVQFGDAQSQLRQGLSASPSFGSVGERKASDDADLTGLDDIDRAYELGLRVNYGFEPVAVFASVRQGLDGHDGLTGEVGATYSTTLGDRVTLWSGIELGYGDADYNNTYFGVTPAEAAVSDYAAYTPGGGFNTAAITFEARYALTTDTALLGEIRYAKLIGDAADSAIVQDEYQPSLRLGVVRRFSFRF